LPRDVDVGGQLLDRPARAALQQHLVRLADGDRAAFRPLFEALWPIASRFAARAVAPADADDAAQQALINVFARAAEFDPSRDALTWLLGVVAWECRTFRRRAARRREAGEPAVALPGDGASPEESAIARDLVAAARAALAELPAADASAVLGALELGERPAVAPATFRKRLQRALGRLRLIWRVKHGAE
jgi:RNA polymerase sigma-70 factor (ECF subfamily)